MQKYRLVLMVLSLGMLTVAGCAKLPEGSSYRIGQFTAASSFNVRNLRYETAKGTKTLVEGKSCFQVDVETGAYIKGPKDDQLQRAMDDAIRQGQDAGIDGDLLVNVRIERRSEYRSKGLIFKETGRYECYVVMGDLVKIVD